MKSIALLMLLASAPAFAQMQYADPQPNQVHVATLTDEEAAKLQSLSDRKQAALKAYFDLRDEYNSTKSHLEDKYDAHAQQGSCETSQTNVEWKGKFIIVERYDGAHYGILFGAGCAAVPVFGGMALTGDLRPGLIQAH